MLRKFTKQTSAIHFGNSIGSILTVIFLLGFSYSANAQIVPIQNLRWSPDGKSLLFDLNQTTIYSVSATPGSKPIPYLPGQATKNSEASFLPNGSIVFTSDRNSNFDIFSESNKKVTALTTDPLNQKSPSVSHDGKKIVFLQETADESDIYNACVMNANGNDSKRVEITAKNVKSPSWLDNNTILCSIKEAAIPFEICALDITTKKYLKLTDNKFMDQQASFSIKNQKVVFTSWSNVTPDIYVMDKDGKSPIQITFDQMQDQFPCWSPNGKQIAFVSDRSGKWCIYIIDFPGDEKAVKPILIYSN